MKYFRSTFLIIGLIAFLSSVFSSSGYAQDTVNVMYFNILNYPGSTPDRVYNFRTINQYVKADVIVVNELLNNTGATSLLQNGLNVYGDDHYSMAIFTNGPDSDNGLYYNSEKFVLYSQDTIETALRLINEYVLYYKIPEVEIIDDTVFFYFYSVHLKASSGSTNEQKRLAEILEFKDHIHNLSYKENVFFGGDFNIYDSDEPGYQELINGDTILLIDPLPAGDWHDEEAYSLYHTQSTRTSQAGGGASGGIDNRFDFILFSEDVDTGTNGVTYVPGSCYALGNDGNHLNKSLIDLPLNTSVPDTVLNALFGMSDHLPVICKLKVHNDPIPQLYSLDLKVYLEGPYNGSNMNTGINLLLPSNQPFNQIPWNYDGVESNDSGFPTNVVDWLLLEVHDAPNVFSINENTLIHDQAVVLLSNGVVRQHNGENLPVFLYSGTIDNVFIVIRHRNHIDITSAVSMEQVDMVITYDFSLSNEKVFGNPDNYTEIGPGTWGMVAGDSNNDGDLSVSDISTWNLHSGNAGYLLFDFNLDGQVDNQDKNKIMIKL